MLVHELLRSLSITNNDIANRFGSLVIDKLKNLDKIITIFITLPENLNNIKFSLTNLDLKFKDIFNVERRKK